MNTVSNSNIVNSPSDFHVQDENNSDDSSSSGISDEDKLAMLEELRTPLEELYLDEFQRYLDLFYRYLPKKPFHLRTRYGGGFICQKGKKKNGEQFFRACYPGLVARMLDHQRQQLLVQCNERTTPNYWIAMNTGKRSALKAIDFDNKDHLLGYYQTGDSLVRPLPTLSLEHLQAVKRLYDAFPGRIWCISSATLGLHLWQRMPLPLPIDVIQAADSPKLQEIGLGGTEIHPMFGRPFRRPFGQDYCTITDHGLLEDWVEQLEYFEEGGETPTFRSIYQGLRSLLLKEWATYRPGDTFSHGKATAHLQKYWITKEIVNRKQLKHDLNVLDNWAEKGFPQSVAKSVSVSVKLNQSGQPDGKATAKEDVAPNVGSDASGCTINLSDVCNGQWVQTCERWAKEGLPCHDSVLPVVSHLSRWFYFIEWWDTPEKERVERIIGLMTDYCLKKHNGFISRLTTGLKTEVVNHVRRIVPLAVNNVDDSGKSWFARIRQKRLLGQYKRVIQLESVIKSAEETRDRDSEDKSLPLPVGFTICCSDLRREDDPSANRKTAEEWVFQADDTPLPAQLKTKIEEAYRQDGKRLYKPTMTNLSRFINHLWKKGGEARLGVKSLAKLGFPDHDARQHLKRLAYAGVILKLKGYSPALGQGLRYRLTAKTKALLEGRAEQSA